MENVSLLKYYERMVYRPVVDNSSPEDLEALMSSLASTGYIWNVNALKLATSIRGSRRPDGMLEITSLSSRTAVTNKNG